MTKKPTDGNDPDITGTPGPDEIDALDGHDTVRARRGDDTVWGGDGDDTLRGNGNRDTIWGGRGHDTLHGGGGNDSLAGGEGNDTLKGGEGNDFLLGGAGDDNLHGGAGNDIFEFVIGSFSNGNDTIHDFKKGENIIRFHTFDENGKSKEDFVIDIDISRGGKDNKGTEIKYSSGDNESTIILEGVDIDKLDATDFRGVGSITHRVDGTEDDDQGDSALQGTKHRDVMDGKGGDDHLHGKGGNDDFAGGAGNDKLYGGDGDDHLFGDDHDGVDAGTDGNDTLDGGKGNDRMVGGGGNDTFVFRAGDGVDEIFDFEIGKDHIRFEGGITEDDVDIRPAGPTPGNTKFEITYGTAGEKITVLLDEGEQLSLDEDFIFG